MQDDFVDFLHQNGINEFEWSILQDQYSDTAQVLLGNYSDQAFDKVMQAVDFLEYRNSKVLRVIKCTANLMHVVGIDVPQSSSIDLLNVSCLSSISALDLSGFKSFRKNQVYERSREHHIFKLIESGYTVTDDRCFQLLNSMRQHYLN